MDRGYNDYGLFGSGTENGIYFVARMKENADYKVVLKVSSAQIRIRSVAFEPCGVPTIDYYGIIDYELKARKRHKIELLVR